MKVCCRRLRKPAAGLSYTYRDTIATVLVGTNELSEDGNAAVVELPTTNPATSLSGVAKSMLAKDRCMGPFPPAKTLRSFLVFQLRYLGRSLKKAAPIGLDFSAGSV